LSDRTPTCRCRVCLVEAPDREVEEQLGHFSIALTSNTYGHVLEARRQELPAAMEAVLG
jgi:hypothetical protein